MNLKLEAGAVTPQITLAKVGGGEVSLGGSGRWQLAIVYRGKHCPVCTRYLKGLDALLEEFQATQTQVIAMSADPKEKAESEVAEEGWRFPVGYGLSVDQMRSLGLYVSEPRAPQETDRPFSEPGLFITNPEGCAQVIDISNAPLARPDLRMVLTGLQFTMQRQLPIRGMA